MARSANAFQPPVSDAIEAMVRLRTIEAIDNAGDEYPISEARATQLGLLFWMAGDLPAKELKHLVESAQMVWEHQYGKLINSPGLGVQPRDLSAKIRETVHLLGQVAKACGLPADSALEVPTAEHAA